MYVMTPEFGAASQLEKIDMLDFAQFVAINKFDRKGAADALRDVAKQVQRNKEAWGKRPEEMPVFGTMAARFNDDGVSALYQALAPRLAELGLARDYNANQLRIHFRNNTEVPYTYIEDLDFETMARFAENDIEVSSDTPLAEIIGETGMRVHSYHHQGVDRLGDGLVAAAHSDDGLVQAFVDTSAGHIVGVQWHPEENAEDRRLFTDLVSQARAFAARRKEDAR